MSQPNVAANLSANALAELAAAAEKIDTGAKFLKPSTLRFSRQGPLQWFPGSPCSSGGSGAGPLMPGVASSPETSVGATDSVMVTPVDISELASVPRLLRS